VTNSPKNDHLTAHMPRSEVAIEGSTMPWVWSRPASCSCWWWGVIGPDSTLHPRLKSTGGR
jgi:hypothetical protein